MLEALIRGHTGLPERLHVDNSLKISLFGLSVVTFDLGREKGWGDLCSLL